MKKTFKDPAVRKSVKEWVTEWKGKASVFTVRFVDDGLLTSDMNLAAIVLNCVDGVDCYQAIPDSGSGSHRFLFYIKGDPKEIKIFVDKFFSGKAKDIMTERLTKFVTTVGTLKMLLDKARVNIVNNNG